ncbi:unnamed protein product [Dibothriocephalus latus]|uniref:Uncharacterized protein n=1 Tax=Dibothriocephalus latus TaxID=60516 RepID=A0A3P6QYM0_DIBLA|nr:unnamed protein product [Dibothriocephalus latus]
MARSIYNDHDRFESVYFSRFPGFFVTGDGAQLDKDGDFWITGMCLYCLLCMPQQFCCFASVLGTQSFQFASGA